jgi:hypothetical protein
MSVSPVVDTVDHQARDSALSSLMQSSSRPKVLYLLEGQWFMGQMDSRDVCAILALRHQLYQDARMIAR